MSGSILVIVRRVPKFLCRRRFLDLSRNQLIGSLSSSIGASALRYDDKHPHKVHVHHLLAIRHSRSNAVVGRSLSRPGVKRWVIPCRNRIYSELRLDGNMLSGTLSSELCFLQQLRYVSVLDFIVDVMQSLISRNRL